MFSVQFLHEDTVGLLFPGGLTALPKTRNVVGGGRCVNTSQLRLVLGVWIRMPKFPRTQRACRMCPCRAKARGTPGQLT